MKKYIIFISSLLILFFCDINVHASSVSENGTYVAPSGSITHTGTALALYNSFTDTLIDQYDPINLYEGADPNLVYAVNISIDYNVVFSKDTYFRNLVVMYANTPIFYALHADNTSDIVKNHNTHRDLTFYIKGNKLNSNYFRIESRYTQFTSGNYQYTSVFDYTVNSVTPLYEQQSNDYLSGYNAGFSEGQTAGYNSGYSDGYSTGKSEGYESGYQAGVNSVDTQSYYDLGYASGWDAGYLTGWDDGYAVGYQDAMDRISSWGADTSDYPKLLNSNVNNTSDITFDVTIKSSIPTQYESFFSWKIDRNLNPNHTYMFEVKADPINISSSDEYAFIINKAPLYLDVGGISYLISNFEANYNDKFYVPGDRMSSAFSFVWRPYCAYMGDSMLNTHGRGTTNIIWKLYDCGPSGDTQNHIANQTDQIMNTPTDNNDKYNSDLDSFDTELDSGISSEEDIMSEQNENITNFEYKPIGEFTGLTSAMSFYSAVVTSAFSSLGDFQGLWVISLTIIFIMVLLRISRRV